MNCTFMYEVIWQQSGDGSSLRNTTTTETSYTIEGLTPGTSYEIGVRVYCTNVINITRSAISSIIRSITKSKGSVKPYSEDTWDRGLLYIYIYLTEILFIF